jgi:hypothetical protein
MLNVLWIEDGAQDAWAYLAGPVYINPKYNLDVVLNVKDAIDSIIEYSYDIFIVDIRLFPGDDKNWEIVYSDYIWKGEPYRLGLDLLYSLLLPKHDKVKIKFKEFPKLLEPIRFAILSVENKDDLKEDINNFENELKVKFPFKEKKFGLPDDALLKLIEEVDQNLSNISNI